MHKTFIFLSLNWIKQTFCKRNKTWNQCWNIMYVQTFIWPPSSSSTSRLQHQKHSKFYFVSFFLLSIIYILNVWVLNIFTHAHSKKSCFSSLFIVVLWLWLWELAKRFLEITIKYNNSIAKARFIIIF